MGGRWTQRRCPLPAWASVVVGYRPVLSVSEFKEALQPFRVVVTWLTGVSAYPAYVLIDQSS